MKSKTFTFRNNRHRNYITVTAEPTLRRGWYKVTKQQASYLRNSLCNIRGCNCGKGPAAACCGDSEYNPTFYAAPDGGGFIVERRDEDA